MARISAAVVGAGFMGGVHTEGLRRAGVDVVGGLGVSAEETEGFVKAQGLPKGYGSF